MSQTTRSTRTAAVAATFVLGGVGAVTVVAAPASAANDWGTLGTLERARVQACKVPATDVAGWKVRLRVKNGNRFWVKATVTAYLGEEAQDSRWRSGRVAGRTTSSVGRVTTGTGEGWTIGWGLGASQFGNGGSARVDDLGDC